MSVPDNAAERTLAVLRLQYRATSSFVPYALNFSLSLSSVYNNINCNIIKKCYDINSVRIVLSNLITGYISIEKFNFLKLIYDG